jgi:hypothetical protein
MMTTLQWFVFTDPNKPPKLRVGNSDNPKDRVAYRAWWRKYGEIERQQRSIDNDDENTPTSAAGGSG